MSQLLNNKHGLTAPTMILVGILILIAGTIVALVLTGQVKILAEKVGQQVSCQLATEIGSIRSTGTAGIVENLPEECRRERSRISKGDLDLRSTLAKTAITDITKNVQNDPNYQELYNSFSQPDNQAQQAEYALLTIIGEHIERCQAKAGGGNGALFDSWWNYVDWPLLGIRNPEDYPRNQEEALLAYKSTSLLVFDEPIYKLYGPPTQCMVCSRLQFDPAIAQTLGKTEITTLGAYLRASPSKNNPRLSIYENILDERQRQSLGRTLEYEFSIDEAQNIEFVRINNFGADIEDIGLGISWALDRVGMTEESESVNNKASRIVIVPTKTGKYPFGTVELDSAKNPVQCMPPMIG